MRPPKTPRKILWHRAALELVAEVAWAARWMERALLTEARPLPLETALLLLDDIGPPSKADIPGPLSTREQTVFVRLREVA